VDFKIKEILFISLLHKVSKFRLGKTKVVSQYRGSTSCTYTVRKNGRDRL